MWRIYFFNERMDIVEYLDRLTVKKPAAYAAAYAKRHGYYSYAIGALR